MGKKEPKNDLIPCEHCGHMISRTAKFCPECGGENKKRMSAGKIIATIILCIITYYLVFFFCFCIFNFLTITQKASG